MYRRNQNFGSRKHMLQGGVQGGRGGTEGNQPNDLGPPNRRKRILWSVLLTWLVSAGGVGWVGRGRRFRARWPAQMNELLCGDESLAYAGAVEDFAELGGFPGGVEIADADSDGECGNAVFEKYVGV